MFKNVLLLNGLVVLCLSACYAYDDKGGWTKVAQVYTNASDGKPFVYFNEGGMPGCYKDKGAYLPISELDHSNKIYGTILAALLANRDVQVFYNYVNPDSGGWGMCEITAVYIR